MFLAQARGAEEFPLDTLILLEAKFSNICPERRSIKKMLQNPDDVFEIVFG